MTTPTPAPSTFITLGNTSGPALHVVVHGDPVVGDAAVVSVPLNQTESRSIELHAGEVLILGDPETIFDTIEDLGSAIKNDVSRLFVHSTPATSQPSVLNLTASDLGGTSAPATGSSAPNAELGTTQTPATPAPAAPSTPANPVGALNSADQGVHLAPASTSAPVSADAADVIDDSRLTPEERAAKQAAKAERLTERADREKAAGQTGAATPVSSAPTGALPADSPTPATSPAAPVQF